MSAQPETARSGAARRTSGQSGAVRIGAAFRREAAP